MKRSITNCLVRSGILKQRHYASYYAFGKILYSVELGDLIASELEFIKEKKCVDEDGREYPIVFHTGFSLPGERFAHTNAIERLNKEKNGEYKPTIVALLMI